MDNRQLDHLLHRLLGDIFCGVRASDQLPLLNEFRAPAYFIVNTHPSHLPGEHWLSLTLEQDGSATFFDSYGFPPDFPHYPSSILEFMESRAEKILYHNRQLQHPLSVVCGQHCVFYLCHRAWGLSYKEILALYHDDVFKNDRMVSDFVNHYRRRLAHHQRGHHFHHGACSLQMFNDVCKTLIKRM